jgi:hypothetical protein
MEFYSTIRKNETLWFEGKWMKLDELEDIMLGEIARFRKPKLSCFFSYIGDRAKR